MHSDEVIHLNFILSGILLSGNWTESQYRINNLWNKWIQYLWIPRPEWFWTRIGVLVEAFFCEAGILESALFSCLCCTETHSLNHIVNGKIKHLKFWKVSIYEPALNHPTQALKLFANLISAWFYFLPPRMISKQSSLLSGRSESSADFWSPLLLLTRLLLLTPKYCHLGRVIFWLLVWSHCKYFQCSITVPKSLHSLPGEKQNSNLRFSCGMFLANIIAARPPSSAGPKTTHLSNLPFLIRLLRFSSAKSTSWR